MALLIAGIGVIPAVARAEYRLQPGDRLGFSILGAPGVENESLVDLDGRVAVPYAGRMAVVGQTLGEVEAAVRDVLAGTAIRLVSSAGEEAYVTLDPSDILIEIAGYAPVYVSGTVAQPGQYPFAPGMTVRQLVAQAGGPRSAAFDPADAARLAIELEARRIVALSRVASLGQRTDRIRASLAALAPEAPEEPVDAPVDEVGREIVAAEARLRGAEAAEAEQVAAGLEARLATLIQRQAELTRLVELDQEELGRVEDLSDRGLTTAAAQSDAQRSLLSANTALLDTMSEIAGLQVDIERVRAQQERRPDVERQQLLVDLETFQADVEIARAELLEVEQRLTAVQGLSEDDPLVSYLLHRNGAGAPMAAGTDDALQPGDVIEVLKAPGAGSSP